MKEVWVCPYCGCEKNKMESLNERYLPTCGQKSRRDIPRTIWHKQFKCACGIILTYFQMRKEERNGCIN